jgi:hypothetical protein
MKKVYVDNSNLVKIACPKCGLEQNKNVFKFKDSHKRLKANCKCGEVFRFTLDFRKYYRKIVRLAGEYIVKGKDEKGEIVVQDISTTGVRFSILEPNHISRNDIVELKFNLDTPLEMEVRTLVKIRWINDQNVGAQFLNPKPLERDLKFYLRT